MNIYFLIRWIHSLKIKPTFLIIFANSNIKELNIFRFKMGLKLGFKTPNFLKIMKILEI